MKTKTETKTDLTRPEIIKGITVLLTIVILCFLAGRISKSPEEMIVYKDLFDSKTIGIGINVCKPPFNAIPNDDLYDDRSYDLAVTFASNLDTLDMTRRYIIKPIILIPVGHYLFRESHDFKSQQMELKDASISIFGIDSTASNNTFENIYITVP